MMSKRVSLIDSPSFDYLLVAGNFNDHGGLLNGFSFKDDYVDLQLSDFCHFVLHTYQRDNSVVTSWTFSAIQPLLLVFLISGALMWRSNLSDNFLLNVLIVQF